MLHLHAAYKLDYKAIEKKKKNRNRNRNENKKSKRKRGKTIIMQYNSAIKIK